MVRTDERVCAVCLEHRKSEGMWRDYVARGYVEPHGKQTADATREKAEAKVDRRCGPQPSRPSRKPAASHPWYKRTPLAAKVVEPVVESKPVVVQEEIVAEIVGAGGTRGEDVLALGSKIGVLPKRSELEARVAPLDARPLCGVCKMNPVRTKPFETDRWHDKCGSCHYARGDAKRAEKLGAKEKKPKVSVPTVSTTFAAPVVRTMEVRAITPLPAEGAEDVGQAHASLAETVARHLAQECGVEPAPALPDRDLREHLAAACPEPEAKKPIILHLGDALAAIRAGLRGYSIGSKAGQKLRLSFVLDDDGIDLESTEWAKAA